MPCGMLQASVRTKQGPLYVLFVEGLTYACLPAYLRVCVSTQVSMPCCYTLGTPTLPTVLFSSSSSLTLFSPVPGITVTLSSSYVPSLTTSFQSARDRHLWRHPHRQELLR